MEKGWIIEYSQSERDFADAGEIIEHRIHSLLADAERDYERAVKKYYEPIGPRKKQLKYHRDRLKTAYYEVTTREYRPWVPAYMFRRLPAEEGCFAPLRNDPWVQTKVYDVLEFPCNTTTFERCVELLKDVRHVYAYRNPNFRIRNVETKEEIPTDWIIET